MQLPFAIIFLGLFAVINCLHGKKRKPERDLWQKDQLLRLLPSDPDLVRTSSFHKVPGINILIDILFFVPVIVYLPVRLSEMRSLVSSSPCAGHFPG